MVNDAPEDGHRPRQGKLPGLLVLLVGIACLLVLTILIFRPFIGPILMAMVIAAVAQPFHGWIRRRVGGERRSTAAALTCVVLVLLVFVPGAWIGWQMVLQAKDGVGFLAQTVVDQWDEAQDDEWFLALREREWFDGLYPSLARSFDRIREALRNEEGLPGVVIEEAIGVEEEAAPAGAEDAEEEPQEGQAAAPRGDLGAQARQALEKALPLGVNLAGRLTSFAASVVANAFEIGIKFLLMVFILFFFFRDGPQLAQSFIQAIPLDAEYQNRVGQSFRTVSRSVIRGSFLTAFVQGAVATVAFAIVGLPAIFWGVMASFCALIPPFGTSLVTAPLVLALFFQGSWGRALFLAVVAVLIGALDNILRPVLVGESLRMHPIWLLLSILGAMRLVGPMGLIYGPMVIVLLGTFLQLLVQQDERAREDSARGERRRVA